MSAIFLLLGVSIVVAAGFLIAFLWSVKNGQYDDDYTPSVRILFDDVKGKSIEDESSQSMGIPASAGMTRKIEIKK